MKKENKYKALSSKEIIEKVADAFLDQMKKGVNPWIKPWAGRFSQGSYELAKYYAFNYVSNKPYTGQNMFLLPAGYYVTYKQAIDLGGKPEKDKSKVVVFGKACQLWIKDKDLIDKLNDMYEKQEEKNSKIILWEGTKKITYFLSPKGLWYVYVYTLRYHRVWNILNCPGIKHLERPDLNNRGEFTMDEKMENAEKIVKDYLERTNLKFRYELGDSAHYSPALDEVVLPERRQFGPENASEFYSTLFHELGHSTGHKSRLNRDLSGWFGIEKYAEEELVAEITASMSLAETELATDKSFLNSASYIQGWADAINKNKSLKDKIYQASKNGLAAFEYIFNYNQKVDEENEKEDGDDENE